MSATERPAHRRSRRPVVVAAVAALVVVAAVLELTYFQFHKHFIDETVNEAAPTLVATGSGTATAAAPSGSFVSRAHTTTGTVRVLSDGNASVLRLEGLRTDNGPDVHVYLVAGADAKADEDRFDDDFVTLGKIKGNIGDQNYEIPAGTDLSRYRTVVLWCKRFSVAFGAADLRVA